jgi:hypothetical protein
VHVHAGSVHSPILEGPDELEARAIPDMGESWIGMSPKRTLVDAALPGAVENRTPVLELQHTIWGFFGVKLGHAPVVDELAALHGVCEVNLP